MVRQDLAMDSTVLETLVSLDWASPTMLECQHYDINPERLHARITYRERGEEAWIIEGNRLRIVVNKFNSIGEVVEYQLILES